MTDAERIKQLEDAIRDLSFPLGQLRHLYLQMIDGKVNEKNIDSIAQNLLSPTIQKIEVIRDSI